MLSAEIERRARALLDHRLRRLPHPVPSAAEWPADMDAAYAIQDAADALLRSECGYVPIGHKIAGTNPVARAHLKIAAPFHGRLYDRQAAETPAGPTEIAFLRVHETEIALPIGRDLPPGEAPFNAETIAAATRAVLPAVEIIGTPFEP